jgi:hypothetical protein
METALQQRAEASLPPRQNRAMASRQSTRLMGVMAAIALTKWKIKHPG